MIGFVGIEIPLNSMCSLEFVSHFICLSFSRNESPGKEPHYDPEKYEPVLALP
jgi:hypothetical protein